MPTKQLISSKQLEKDTVFPKKVKNMITRHINGKNVAAHNAKSREKCEKIPFLQLLKDIADLMKM